MRRSVASFLFLFGWLSVAEGTQSVRVGFEDLVGHSEKIFLGSVVSVRQEAPAPGRRFPSVVTLFRVEEVYKGSVPVRMTIRQFGLSDPGAGLNRRVGLRTFVPGERVVVFLSSESRIGLVSPIGFGQGVFRLGKGAGDQALVVNSLGNRGLFRGTRNRALGNLLAKRGWQEREPARLTLGDLRDLIGVVGRRER